jgi:hypothetical protein
LVLRILIKVDLPTPILPSTDTIILLLPDTVIMILFYKSNVLY